MSGVLPVFSNVNCKLQRRRSDVLMLTPSNKKRYKTFSRRYGGLHEEKACNTFLEMVPTNVKAVHQISLLHIESNRDRLGLLSPTHGLRFQQQSGLITLPSTVLINKPKFLKATRHMQK